MNELMIFENHEFGSIRTLEIDGFPYWVAVDVTKALGYKRSNDAVKQHCKSTVKHRAITRTGERNINIIPESDLYRLIVHSKLPGAERFEKWVFEEVLPAIRKNGTFTASTLQSQQTTPELKEIRNELVQLRTAISELASGNAQPRKALKSRFDGSSKAAFRKIYVNLLLDVLEKQLSIPKMTMIHQAYREIERGTNINLEQVRISYATKSKDNYCSVLEAVCHSTEAATAFVRVLHYNAELEFMD